MRSILFFIFLTSLFFTTIQCKKDTVDQLSLLPLVTTNGANTFGCIVNGTAMLPRTGVPTWGNPYYTPAIEPIIDTADKIIDIAFINGKDSYPLNFLLKFHILNYNTLQPGDYDWKQSSFGTETFTYFFNHVYGSFYNDSTKANSWYGSYDGSGKTTITRCDYPNHIISATFSGKLREKNGTKEITIANGRFDIDWNTAYKKNFP